MLDIIILILILIITIIIIHLGSTSEPQLLAECFNVTLEDLPGRQGDSLSLLRARNSVHRALCMLSARDWMQRGGDACCMLMSLI